MRMKLLALLGGVVGCAAGAQADQITIAGYEYKDVLITQSSSFYYVQLPEEGRTLSVPISEIPAGSVKINKDPFYRTPLKAKYDENRQRRAAGEIKDVDPAFRATSSAPAGSGATLAELQGGAAGGGASAGGFGVARTMIEGALGGFGFTVEAGPTSAIATNPSGANIELQGPPESLQGIVAKMSGPVAAVDQGATQMQMFLMQLKPDAVATYTEAVKEAKANGSSSKSAAGVNINIKRQVNGANADAEIRITAN